MGFADLVLPDTTYLERHDTISLLDRPISDADGPADAIRQPVFTPDRDVRSFQSVLIDLGPASVETLAPITTRLRNKVATAAFFYTTTCPVGRPGCAPP